MEGCPLCGDRRVTKIDDKLFRCAKCGVEFDGEDDGTIGYGPPSRRIEREERRQSTKRTQQRR